MNIDSARYDWKEEGRAEGERDIVFSFIASSKNAGKRDELIVDELSGILSLSRDKAIKYLCEFNDRK